MTMPYMGMYKSTAKEQESKRGIKLSIMVKQSLHGMEAHTGGSYYHEQKRITSETFLKLTEFCQESLRYLHLHLLEFSRTKNIKLSQTLALLCQMLFVHRL